MNILMINLPYSGHTNPTLPLTEMLVRKGHNVTYINAESFRGKIERTGARFVPYNDFPVGLSDQKIKCGCFRAAYDTAMALDEQFDILIYEMFFYPGIDIAQRKGIPCVRQFSQPAWSQRTLEEASPVFRISAKLIDSQVMNRKNRGRMNVQRSMSDAVVNDRPNLNIVYVPEEFQKHREDFGDDYIFAVPPQQAHSCDTVIPYEEMRHPVVYISLGSIISNRGFCKECIRAFGRKDMSVILNTGNIAPESLGRIPDNIYAYSFVPQIEVLDHADVFLTHCGMNSVNESLLAGVPMVAMPFVNDQTENAKRIVELGIGKRVRSFPSRGKDLYRAVCEVYNDEKINRQIKELSGHIKDCEDWEAVISEIENAARKKTTETTA